MGKHVRVKLSVEDRADLKKLVKDQTAGSRKINRAKVLLLLDGSEGQAQTGKAVAQGLGLSSSMVSQVARRYAAGGLKAAMEEKARPGRGVKITGEVEAQLIALACQKPEAGQAKWSMRMLAGRLVELELVDSISHVAVMNRLKKINSNLGKSKVGVSPRRRMPAL